MKKDNGSGSSSFKLYKFPEQDAITNRLVMAFMLMRDDEDALFYIQQCLEQMTDLIVTYEECFEVDRVYDSLLDCIARVEHLREA